jgi:predicted HTH domain antitoxin
MTHISIAVPEGLTQILKMSEEDFAREASMLLAVKLYELGKVSAGIAAQIAGLDRITFLTSLSRYRVPAINLQSDEVIAEIEAARTLAKQ